VDEISWLIVLGNTGTAKAFWEELQIGVLTLWWKTRRDHPDEQAGPKLFRIHPAWF